MKPFIIGILSLLISVTTMAQLKVGDRAPMIAAKNLDGSSFQYQNYQGKYLLIDVWASWCGPCFKAFEEFKKLYKKAPKTQFEIIGISLDNSSSTWTSTVNRVKLPWKQYHAPGNFNSPVVSTWGVEYLPATYLVNPQGIIEMIDPSPKDLKKFISKLK